MIKYGKSAGDIMNFKRSFLEDNQKRIDYNNWMREVYLKQEKRKV